MPSKIEFLKKWEGKGNHQGRKPTKIRTPMKQMIRNDGIQTNSKSKTSCADSNLRPRCEDRGTSKNLTRLRPRDEARIGNPPSGRRNSGSKSYGSAL
ncbi:hypothetical protein AVEN_83031-1 [Araneus ventricosus]|uniref:Uncharacterized protein n=1 Tax=Araneus ventricosus TaxID=182803 RepID=A0A4Y2IRZ3_ARAVE|nr:hypothetical protein AVEN_83031-1 [Araneus ventricosus]